MKLVSSGWDRALARLNPTAQGSAVAVRKRGKVPDTRWPPTRHYAQSEGNRLPARIYAPRADRGRTRPCQCHFSVRPRTGALPRAPVTLPSATTRTPLATTCSTPTGALRGSM